MSDLVFYTNPHSRGPIVHRMLEKLAEPYETVRLDFGIGTKSAEYLAINPMGKVSALKHLTAIITEVVAICTYLAVRFPEKKLIPSADDPSLSSFYRWMFFAAGPLEQTVTAKGFDWEIPEGRNGTAGFGSHEDVMNVIEIALTPGPYICGDQFTAADVYVGSHLNWGMGFGGVDKRPLFEEYVSRIISRPASQRADQINEAKLGQTES